MSSYINLARFSCGCCIPGQAEKCPTQSNGCNCMYMVGGNAWYKVVSNKTTFQMSKIPHLISEKLERTGITVECIHKVSLNSCCKYFITC
jgi:hypothetical protein